jgi:hypothetical protein
LSFRSDNDAYEAWLARQCAVAAADIKYKHKRMKKNAFVFLRATYFRWAKTIETLCPELTNAPLQADLKKRPRGWLHAAAKTAEQAVQHDFMSWRK